MDDLRGRLQAAVGGAYRIERELGRGGMSRVFVATDLELDRPVAVKVLPPEMGAGVSLERFRREIQLAASLQHPHIVPVLAASRAGDLVYYTMPLIEGESLRAQLDREGQLPLATSVRILRDIVDALAYAHHHGIVHRDVKPDNVLVTHAHAVVTDFGVAKAISDATGVSSLTSIGVTVGTPAYMAPEQAAADPHTDTRADIYSAGAVAYEMLAGRTVFTATTAQAMIAAQITRRPEPLATHRADVPPGLEAIVMRCLEKDVADRYSSADQLIQELDRLSRSGEAGGRTARRRQLLITGGISAAVIAAGVLAGAVLRRNHAAVVPAAAVMAVVPFAPSTPDTALTRMGRDLVVTLSSNLDGVGDIRTVDALTVLAQTSSHDPLSLSAGVALARRLGASSVLHGTLIRSDRGVRLDLGLFTTDTAAPLARATVTTSAGDVAVLTDSATWAVLRQVWRSRGPPTPSLSAVTTRSVPALRAFLDGERLIGESRWVAASAAFARAIEADSTFWLAYRRYAYAHGWYGAPVDSTIQRAYLDHRAELPERDRLLIEAAMGDSLSARIRRLQRITEKYPDYWPGWFGYADQLVHWGPTLGYTNADARTALERTLTLNPALASAWQHLAWVTLAWDVTAAERATETYARLGGGRAFADEVGIDDSQLYRMEVQLLRGEHVSPALRDSLVREMPSVRLPYVAELGVAFMGSHGLSAQQIDFANRVLGAHPPPETARALQLSLAIAWAARGAWDSAFAYYDAIARPSADQSLERYRQAAIAAWLGAMTPDEALRRRVGAAAAAPGQVNTWRAELAWLDGLLAITRGDTVALNAARNAVRQTNTATASLLNRSLMGLEGVTGKRTAESGRALASLEWERPDLPDTLSGYAQHPFLIGVNRLAAARALLANGDAAQAARLLTWIECMVSGPRAQHAIDLFTPLTYLERARIEAARGNGGLARRYYNEFLHRYDTPPPSHRGLIEEARAALNER